MRKTGIRLHGLLCCDRIWMTCLSLHNCLLEVDGLSKDWESGVSSYYETDDDKLDVTFAIRALNCPNGAKVYDFSRMDRGNDCNRNNYISDNTASVQRNEDISINICDLSLESFRNKFITHFNILFQENKIYGHSVIEDLIIVNSLILFQRIYHIPYYYHMSIH